jgi:hypothetical protein
MARPHRNVHRRIARLLACLSIAGRGCHSRDGDRDHDRARVSIAVPRARETITLDGEWAEPAWDKVAVREVFVDAGAEARPFSEVRFLRDRDHLYVGLYAADEDIHSSEAFELAIGSLHLRVDAAGRVTPSTPGLRVAVDRDGTLDDTRDSDEEWVIELAIPLSAVGLVAGSAGADVHAGRCDTPKDGRVRCGAWDGRIDVPLD